MTRIRYNVENEVTLRSKPVVVDGQLVEIVLHLARQQFEVTNVDTGKLVISGSGKDASQLKLNAKKELIKLGASFGVENRNRKKELV